MMEKERIGHVEGSTLVVEEAQLLDLFQSIIDKVTPEQVFGCVAAGINSKNFESGIFGALT